MTHGAITTPDLLLSAYNKLVSGDSFRPANADEIAQLAQFGFTTVNGEVKLSDDTELLDLQLISKHLPEDVVARLNEIEVLPCVESTNDLMQERARSISIDGTVVMAEVQTAGRGRRGRRWETPFGKNIAMSLGVGLDIPASRVAPLSLVVGIATAETLQAIGVQNVGLKWPNDILVDERKVGGILTELATATRPVEVVIGIGINVGGAGAIRDRVEYPIADVCEYVRGAVRNQLAGELIGRVMLNCGKFEESGLAPFRDRWTELDVLFGRYVVISGPKERAQGRATGIDSEGRFLLKDDSGKVHATIAGDVTLRELT